MAYPPGTLESIKARLNLVDEVRRSVPSLKKTGPAWKGLCPFHSEKSPSFNVRESHQAYKCFGCGASGDIFTFVQEMRGLTFPQAVEELAERAGVTLPKQSAAESAAAARFKEEKDDGFKALERAIVFFQRSLNEDTKAYIAKRALSPETVQEFMLGYSPDSFSELKDSLLSEGFSSDVLLSVGLIGKSDKGRGDYVRFRNRLMFPIHDARGRPVGFGGRSMADGEQAGPKYLNSSETPFFSKKNLLFNLNRARENIRRTKQVLLVEGYMDVIALWQAGIKTAVAPMGTSVTPEQVTLLWQQADAPIVCLDGDNAGRTAAYKVASTALPLLEPGKTLNFIFMPEGEDPDSLVQKDGPSAMHRLLAAPLPLEAVLWQQATAGHNLTTADGRSAAEGNIAHLLSEIKNNTVKTAYKQVLKDKLWKEGRPGSSRKAQEQIGVFKQAGQASADYRPSVQGDAPARMVLALFCHRPALLLDNGEILGNLSLPAGELQELQQTLTRAVVRNQIDAESADAFRADLLSGPQSGTVSELIRNTGLETADEQTDWQAELFTQARAHAQRQKAVEDKENLKKRPSFNADYFQALQQATQRGKRGS